MSVAQCEFFVQTNMGHDMTEPRIRGHREGGSLTGTCAVIRASVGLMTMNCLTTGAVVLAAMLLRAANARLVLR